MSRTNEVQEWQKGNNCKLKPEQRIEQHNLWLKEIHKEFRQSIQIVKHDSYLSEEELEKERK